MKVDLIGVFFGLTLGFILFGLILWIRNKMNPSAGRGVSEDALVEKLKGIFASLSIDALSKNSEEFLRLAQQKLESVAALGKKDLENNEKLIDQTLGNMKDELAKVQEFMRALEKDRESKFLQLSDGLDKMTEGVAGLTQTTEHLKSALSNAKARGQWGERMAEDVLKLAGFIEGINYAKQKAQGEGRPDFTFFLPQGLKVNMDVKFPLDNYLRFFDAKTQLEKDNFKLQFLRDAKERIKEVRTRDYIDPEQKTVGFVIVFIPNEQVYAFINENDRSILDEAMKQKVVFCSPLTLYAILAVIRQAMDTFKLEHTAHKILSVLEAFRKQYEAFCFSLEKIGTKIDDAKKEYDNLTTTRKNQLDRQLKKIDELRNEKLITQEGPEDEN